MENKITGSLPVSSWKINSTCITCEMKRQSFHSVRLSETSIISVLFLTNMPVCTEATDKPRGRWELGVMLPEPHFRQTLVKNIMHKYFIVFWEAGSNMDQKFHNLPHKDEFQSYQQTQYPSHALNLLWACWNRTTNNKRNSSYIYSWLVCTQVCQHMTYIQPKQGKNAS